MTSGVKIALIVGGTAVGAFVLLRMLAPSPTLPSGGAKNNSDLTSIQGILGLGSSIFGAFGRSGGSSTPAAVYDTPSGFVATKQEWQNIADYNAQPGDQYGIAGLDY